jgi:acetyl/propionyl-CoA carboxylase alpha subunit
LSLHTSGVTCLHSALCDHPRFKQGAINTNFIPEEYPKGFLGHQLVDEEKRRLAQAAVLLYSRAIANQGMIYLPSRP